MDNQNRSFDDSKYTAPTAPQEDKPRSGCLKWGLIGCGTLAVLGVIALILFVLFAPRIMNFGLNKMKEGIMESLPEDADKAEIRRQLDLFIEAAKNKEITAAEIQDFTGLLQTVLEDGKISEGEAEQLESRLNEILDEKRGGGETPAAPKEGESPGGEPAPEPSS